MEGNLSFDPVDASLSGTDGVMVQAHHLMDLVQDFHFWVLTLYGLIP